MRFHSAFCSAVFALVFMGAARAQDTPAPPVPIAKPAATATDSSVFSEKPYLQLGDAPKSPGKTDRVTLLWHSDEAAPNAADWSVRTRPASGAGEWLTTKKPPEGVRVALEGVPVHTVYSVVLDGLPTGQVFSYQVLKNNAPVFETTANLPRKTGKAAQTSRFVVFGDCAADTPGQRKIAYQTFLQKPDYVFVTGDIVYSAGRASEYRKKYFPVYNNEVASPETGAPLLRSTVFMATPGNHDILNRDLAKNPDDLAYFYYWKQPLNGPLKRNNEAYTPTLSGPDDKQAAFLSAAGDSYPRMANFSFDMGNAHWSVLDANPYTDWSDKKLSDWLEKDLQAAQKATWRFVAFHQPGFNSSKDHFSEQHMRVLAPLFEKYHVSIVFSGHVHNYQRTFPMTFAPVLPAPNKGEVGGAWVLDKSFDGQTQTRPTGVIYIITGAGGANLYNPEQQDKPDTWQAFTHKFIADTHSFTRVDITGKTLTIHQISEDGKTLDAFQVTP